MKTYFEIEVFGFCISTGEPRIQHHSVLNISKTLNSDEIDISKQAAIESAKLTEDFEPNFARITYHIVLNS